MSPKTQRETSKNFDGVRVRHLPPGPEDLAQTVGGRRPWHRDQPDSAPKTPRTQDGGIPYAAVSAYIDSRIASASSHRQDVIGDHHDDDGDAQSSRAGRLKDVDTAAQLA